MKSNMKSRMRTNRLAQIALVVVALLALTSLALTSAAQAEQAPGLVDTVRQATATFADVAEAEQAGYALFHGCVSGTPSGAMGVHFVNGDLVADGELEVEQPEALLYEVSYGALRLVGVEYVVLADDWHVRHDTPPVLMGQLFNYVSSPNRYGIPAFYELHVWAHKHNANGMFADWNPHVSCEEHRDATAHQELAE